MVKSYVIDTNVLIQAPYALQCFEDNQVILPLVVLEELDGLKKSEGERGANARRVIRFLEKLRGRGDLLKGVELEHGGFLRVESNCVSVMLPESLPEDKADNRILKVCKGLAEGNVPVVLVTKDLVLRMKAQILGIEAQDFSTEQVIPEEEQYSGRTSCFVPEERFKEFRKKGIEIAALYQTDGDGNRRIPELVENEFVILKADQSVKKTHLGRVSAGKVVPLEYRKSTPYGVAPRNAGQYFLQEALMKPAKEAPLVIVKGMAGTAKTFYSLAVGLEKIVNHPSGEYRRILICRPNAQFDEDIGFLPGDEQTEALNFIRGRSFVKTYLIIDEAQNMTPNQVKGIITRAGAGTKIILLGDPGQIDKPFLDERTNGLSYASEKMKGSPLCWQVTMSAEECERSALAMDAIQRL